VETLASTAKYSVRPGAFYRSVTGFKATRQLEITANGGPPVKRRVPRTFMKCVDDFRLKSGKKNWCRSVIGGIGVDISTAELALEAVRLGGHGAHLGCHGAGRAQTAALSTSFVKDKTRFYKHNIDNSDKSIVKFDLGVLAEATARHVGSTSWKPSAAMAWCSSIAVESSPSTRRARRFRCASPRHWTQACDWHRPRARACIWGTFGLIANHSFVMLAALT